MTEPQPHLECQADDEHLIRVHFAEESNEYQVVDTWERSGHVPAVGALVSVAALDRNLRVTDHHWDSSQQVTLIVKDTGE